MEDKLFAVFLGGRATKCNIELHDVVFVVGQSIEDTYEQLMAKWFGSPRGLHIDSWIELSIVDGYRVSLARHKHKDSKKLFFINLGGYVPGLFGEMHANSLMVADSEKEVKERATKSILKEADFVHTDDVYEVDDCLEISEVDGYNICLTPTTDRIEPSTNNGYHIIPKKLVELFMQRTLS